jgi:ActR/RegA family two-component response regulator
MARIALVVDDMPAMVRALRRSLASCFDQIYMATSKTEAEAALAAASPPVTHLVCDDNLGDGEQPGSELIPVLRAAYPTIRLAVLLTGGSNIVNAGALSGIDRVFVKPCDMDELERFLQSDAERSG